MKQFKLVDNIFGWVAFMIAAFVYCSTIEPTASFWDCPEFISTGYKLEVGHPPGAPFFMLTANLFSQFASDPSDVARMVNTMSALLSAACIMFLFWTITNLGRKLMLDPDRKEALLRGENMPLGTLIGIEAAGMVGALIYTFSDTFWFSAVEGEVYAYSSAFTAVVFWLILKWEDHADEPHADRWLVLIFYLTGLSIGVHLLNLLCLPAIVLVYYYKRTPDANLKGSCIALCISFVLIAAILYGVVPGIVKVGGWFELLFVNVLGMPFNTGEIVYIFTLIGVVLWGVYESYTQKDKTRENISFCLSILLLGITCIGFGWSAGIVGLVLTAVLFVILKTDKGVKHITSRIKNTTLLSLLMIMIGYSSYAVIVIRSAANTPMDQNSPEDIFTLGNYLSRDQYGDTPLLYGQTFASEYKFGDDGRVEMKKGAPIYSKVEKKSDEQPDEYFIVDSKDKPKFAQNVLFPRMHSKAHAGAYDSWLGGIQGSEIPSTINDGTIVLPTMFENIQFFLSYQVNFMYWRYFMWNFAGRQNDIQGNGEIEHGNWITGIPFIDNILPWSDGLQNLPDELANNKGHNVFYCLPLLLGLIGLFFQAYRGKRGIQQFWIVCFLFFMTGLAIVLYLNQTPQQPRERDYAYAGSFYAYAIWCGIGVLGIIEGIKKAKVNSTVASAVAGVACLLVPVQMASQTWDDHDRSGRYTCRDFGQNYLNSLQEGSNPIIFTNGDNDTFPLWYNQDVEGKGTDVRVCNLSYLATDWYIDQMVRPAYDSPSLPITWKRYQYCSGVNDMVYVEPEMKDKVLSFYESNPEAAKKQFGNEPFELRNVLDHWVCNPANEDYHCIPTDTLYLTIDKNAVRKSGMMIPDSMEIPDKMAISLSGKRALYKNDLMMLEMLANHNWTRPLYVATTVGADNFMNLGDNFIQEGLANRITPFNTKDDEADRYGEINRKNFDTKRAYNNVVNRFKFGGLSTKGIYLDETVMRMCYTHRRMLSNLAERLLDKGEKDKARKIAEICEKEIPAYNVPRCFADQSVCLAKVFAETGDKAKAKAIINDYLSYARQYLDYISKLPAGANTGLNPAIFVYIIGSCADAAESVDEDLAQKLTEEANALHNAMRR
ncbi:MAG: DUF2723 domain-containing protein [Bacteroidaceae bacterium]|nr:DUF2723 domain-containing protein [Bacteroidaceae bacterium]